MKAVLMSIHPKWCELIALGKKTVEVRKTKPKIKTSFKVYIYCTKDRHGWFDFLHKQRRDGKIIGEFVCDKILFANGTNFVVKEDAEITLQGTCLTEDDIYKYLGIESGMSRYDKKTEFYRWHISDIVIYDKPRCIDDFRKAKECHRGKIRENCIGCWDCEITRPPQSWCYVEEMGAEQ